MKHENWPNSSVGVTWLNRESKLTDIIMKESEHSIYSSIFVIIFFVSFYFIVILFFFVFAGLRALSKASYDDLVATVGHNCAKSLYEFLSIPRQLNND